MKTLKLTQSQRSDLRNLIEVNIMPRGWNWMNSETKHNQYNAQRLHTTYDVYSCPDLINDAKELLIKENQHALDKSFTEGTYYIINKDTFKIRASYATSYLKNYNYKLELISSPELYS